jgi:hypothetical protein
VKKQNFIQATSLGSKVAGSAHSEASQLRLKLELLYVQTWYCLKIRRKPVSDFIS